RTRRSNSASGSSAGLAWRQPRPDRASGYGSRTRSCRPTAARSRLPAKASIKAPRSRSTFRMWPTLPHLKPMPMNEPKSAPVVLVIDDEVQIRRFLRAGLELDGFVVQDAETGAEALKTVTLRQPDLVILDLGLPDMDGGEVLERLRSWSTVPLIVLSVRSNEAEKVRLLSAGADDYVVKPFGMAELLARAHAAMRRQVRAANDEPVVR